MVDSVLVQKAVLEALEGKIEALRAVDELNDDIIIKLYFWDDLTKKHPKIFRSATLEDVVLAISVIEKESASHFKLMSIRPYKDARSMLSVPMIQEEGRPIVDISNLYWEIRYIGKLNNQETVIDSKIFWLTPRDIRSLISGKECSLPFNPNGVQYRLLEWFSENKEFRETKKLAENLNTTSRTISTEISKLKQKAKKIFGIDNFIESSKGEGYKINKKIKIKKE